MLNICLCDDGALQRAYLKLIIQEYESRSGIRFSLSEFSSGEDLLEQFQENPTRFDLYFLDQRMKNITGLETASSIRQRNKDCAIVFVTASEGPGDFEAVSPLRVLNKPAQPAAVYEVLDQVFAALSPGYSR
ncbi:response regulator receiver protein [Desulfitobacterium sp. LBE]|uniref:response regulator n=1 Tax=Desulfitobacterium TaxID=36853 RepID=UPI000376642F|nr:MULTISPECIES: response regulator [Desulfitobacterium]TWH56758.1 response regulator receiver protein [Desulfitobacterium sp. LBE]